MKWIVALVLSPYSHREIVKYDDLGAMQSQIFWAFNEAQVQEILQDNNENNLPVEYFPKFTAPR